MEEKGLPVVLDLEDVSYEVIKKGGEGLGCRMMRGIEEAWAALHFDWRSMVGDTQNGGSIGSKEEDDPWVGCRWAKRTGPKGQLAQLDAG
jgi:hypothetical protein